MSSDPQKSTAVAKSSRHRKKNYYNSIRKQMEFYFGDANLSKDRFLMSMIKTDQYVPLTTFMTFNKMKVLAKDVEDIAKSVTNSDLLELNESGTAVRRRTAIPEDRNADDRTIYVESIPQSANHDTVIKAFSRYGPVAYVSLPKYKNSKRLKEFGFVEFDDIACITKVLKAFQAFNGVLAFESAKPEELTSIRAFISEQKEQQTAAEMTEKKTEYSATSGNSSDTSSEISSQPPTKRAKIKSDIETPTSELETTNDHKIKKKRRHRKRLKKTAITMNRGETELGPLVIEKAADASTSSGELDVTQLRITSKREWKRLRNRYLNLQRDKMSELKRRNHQRIVAVGHRTTASTAKFARTVATQKLLIHRSPHNMNFYQDRGDPDNQNSATESNSEASGKANSATGGDQENVSTTTTAAAAKLKPIQRDPLIHYESGLIVNIRFVEPCVDVKAFKLKMRQYDPVKYVDVKEGSIEAYLRCSDASAAKKLCRQIAEQYSCEILTGSREQTYWQKIMHDRSEKLNKAVKIKSRRGGEKLKQMNIHLRFDGADD